MRQVEDKGKMKGQVRQEETGERQEGLGAAQVRQVRDRSKTAVMQWRGRDK